MLSQPRIAWQGRGAAVLFVALLALAAPSVAEAATGDLSAPGCLSGNTDTVPRCTLTADADGGGASSGFDTIQSVDVGPDPGNDVYAVSQQDDAVIHLDRNPSTGAVTFAECITGEAETGPSGSGACAAVPAAAPFPTSNSGFDSPVDAVVSPDGENVYAVAENDDSVIRFDRDLVTGALTYVDCLTAETESGTGSGGPCTTIAGATSNGTNTGLDSPTGIAISPGGTSIYVTARISDSIAHFTRAPATGALTYVDCISADSDVACDATGTTSSDGEETGFGSPYSPVVSDDGDNVYAGSSDDASIAWFDRTTPGGALTWNDCITGDTLAGPTGTNACPTAVPSATSISGDGTSSGLARPQSIAIPPGGDQVYTGSQLDSAVYYFGRNAGTGDLIISGCLSGNQTIVALSPGSCSLIPTATAFGDNSGLRFVQSVAISPDGKSLYAAAAGDDAIATFDRALATGDIDWDSCFSGETASGPAGTGACQAPNPAVDGEGSGLDALRSLAVTPDGLQVIGGAEEDDSIVFAARSNAPQTTLLSGPPPLTNNPSPSFTFSADEAPVSFQCRVDSGPFGPCSGVASHVPPPLADGSHVFQVRARNDVPTPDPTPVTVAFTVDTVPPESSISAGPTGTVATRDVRFEFSATGDAAGFECRVDGGGFSGCTSPHSLSLADGSHTFEVRAEDAAGNVEGSPASRSFAIDTVAPDTSITTSPKKTVRTGKDKKKATFRFITTEPGAFECRRDKGKDFKPCTSPYKKKYKRGKHTFTVRAVDDAGNVGKSDSHTWKVKRKK